MPEDRRGCFSMLVDATLAALVLLLTVMVLVLVARLGSGGEAAPGPDHGTPGEVSEALERALEQG